jgi:hypothetical protein
MISVAEFNNGLDEKFVIYYKINNKRKKNGLDEKFVIYYKINNKRKKNKPIKFVNTSKINNTNEFSL